MTGSVLPSAVVAGGRSAENLGRRPFGDSTLGDASVFVLGGIPPRMRVKLKPLSEQVIVVFGASSGIGRATATMAAARGARVVAAGRDQRALSALANESGPGVIAASLTPRITSR